jgi:glutathione S-transferase
VRLYYSPGACSLASHIVLEETGLPFEAVRTPTAEGAHRTPEYRAINPRGFVPALEEDGRVLTENAAIMLYLAHRRPEAGLLPEEPEPLGRCLEWLSWQASTAHIAFAQHWRPERFADGEEERRVVVAGAGPRIRRVLAEIESWLAKHPYAAGDVYSIADPMFLVLYRWGWRVDEPVGPEAFPAWTAHIERVTARPAVRRVLEREGINLFQS